MCNKPFDSIICNFSFFLIAFSGLAAISGVSLRLGGLLMQKTDPENTEYPLYASESGFLIGVKSGGVFQWLTAAFIVLCAKANASDADSKIGKYIAMIFVQNLFLIILFGALHVFSLPISVQNHVDCFNFKERIMELRGTEIQNPLCEAGHSWEKLFTAFSLGTSISYAGCLLLQMIYVGFRAACETAVTPPAEVPSVVVTNPALVNVAVEMIPVSLNS